MLPTYLSNVRKNTSKKGATKQYCSQISSVFKAEPVLILDSGCDQSVLSQGWKILPETVYEPPNCSGLKPALSTDGHVVKMKLGSAIATLLSLTGKPLCLLRVNQAYLSPLGGRESMLAEDQIREKGINIQKRKVNSLLESIGWKCPIEVHSTGCTSFLRL